MKSFFCAALVTGLLALPAVSFAQDANVSVTHAAVGADLISLQQAGYRPSKLKYPADVQTAEAHLNGQDLTASSNSDVGGVSNGSSQMSAPMTMASAQGIYSHH
jgi:hypothetical protein